MLSKSLKIISFLVLTLPFAGACSNGGATTDDDDATKVSAIPVESVKPERGDIDSTYSGTAAIEAFADAGVVAKVGGEVRRVLVEEGDDVRSGDVLAVLDGDRLRLEVAATEAQLNKLKRDYQRNIDLKDRSLISAGDFEKIQYEMEALQASHDMAKLQLSYTEIRAPIDGVVSERFIKVGNTLDVNAPAFEITSLEPLVSYLHLPEREYGRLKAGQTAQIEVDALPNDTFEAIVARVSPTVDPATGTFKLTLEVSDATRRVKPGMFARITIVSDRRENVLQIPRGAIVEDADTQVVFVIDGDTVTRRSITTGYSANGLVEVVAGLEDGEEVVVVGQAGLKEGSRVSVVNSEPNAEQAMAAKQL